MLIMIFIKMAADLSLFMLAGGTIAVACGASELSVFLTILLTSLAVTLSYFLREKKILRYLSFLLVAAGLFATLNIAWMVVSAVCIAYGIYIVTSEKYIADPEHQKTIFKITIGALLAGLLIVFLAGGESNLYAVVIYCALISLICSVLVMRSMRHEPSIYRSYRFQALNLAIVMAVLIVILVVSSGPVLNGIWIGIKAVYSWIAYALMYIVMFIITGGSKLFKWVLTLFGNAQSGEAAEVQMPQLDNTSGKDIFGEVSGDVGLPGWLKISLGILAILIIILVLILFFRYLSGRGIKDNDEVYLKEGKKQIKTVPIWNPESVPEGQQVVGVRKQYRKYLKFLKEKGQTIGTDQTSKDIINGSFAEYNTEEARELRRLYLKARYNNEADKEDAEKAKKLLNNIKSIK